MPPRSREGDAVTDTEPKLPHRRKRRLVAAVAVTAGVLPVLYVLGGGPAAYGVERGWVSPAGFSAFTPLLRFFRPGLDNPAGNAYAGYVAWWVELAAEHEGREAFHAP
jgi:hypothetical protein